MGDVRILIVVQGDEARGAYEGALARIGASFDVAGSFNDALAKSMEHAYHGMMIDILTLVRCSKEEKLIAYDCLNLYPSIRVKWDARKGEINLSMLEQSFAADTEASLRFFVDNKCRSFPPRSLRRHHRASLCLNVLLSGEPEAAPDDCCKTFTVNVSRGGAFIHTTRPFAKDDPVWLRLRELSDQTPIRSRVRWGISWGESRCICGIGVAFEALSESQSEELGRMLRCE